MLEKITSFITVIVLAIGGFFAPTPEQPVAIQEPEVENFGGFSPVAGNTYRLKSSLGSADTSITLSSFTEPITGNKITMTTLNSDIGYATIDPQSSTRKEFVSFTGVTQNNDGSAMLTGVSRGLGFQYPFTASSTLRKSHPGQSIFILSDSPQLFNEYARIRSNETITGHWTFPTTSSASSTNSAVTLGFLNSYAMLLTTNQSASGNKTFTGNSTLATTSITSLTLASGTISHVPVIGNDITNKTYVDGVAVAGASDADETTKGIVEEATTAETIAGTATGGTSAKLFVTPAKLQDAFSAGVSTSTTGTYNGATTTFTITSGQGYMVFASGVCHGTNSGAADGVLSLRINNVNAKVLNNVGAGSSGGVLTGLPFSMNYASSTPASTTVSVLLTNDASNQGCDQGLSDVSVEYLILPS